MGLSLVLAEVTNGAETNAKAKRQAKSMFATFDISDPHRVLMHHASELGFHGAHLVSQVRGCAQKLSATLSRPRHRAYWQCSSYALHCPLWVIRYRSVQRPRRSMSAMPPIATRNGAAPRMTLCANRGHPFVGSFTHQQADCRASQRQRRRSSRQPTRRSPR